MADTTIAGENVGFPPAWAACALSALSDRLAAEGERRLLWLPVFFGAGIGFYFALRVEPPLWPWVAWETDGVAPFGISEIGWDRPRQTN